ncbi:hypothetical protein ABKV19_018056 [Rosa sericea]
MNPSPILVQDTGDEKPCTSGHGVVVAAVAPELCSEKITGLIKDITLCDPDKLDVGIPSGSQKSGYERVCTQGVVVAAATKEPPKCFSGLIKVITTDPQKCDAVNSSGSRKSGGERACTSVHQCNGRG